MSLSSTYALVWSTSYGASFLVHGPLIVGKRRTKKETTLSHRTKFDKISLMFLTGNPVMHAYKIANPFFDDVILGVDVSILPDLLKHIVVMVGGQGIRCHYLLILLFIFLLLISLSYITGYNAQPEIVIKLFFL